MLLPPLTMRGAFPVTGVRSRGGRGGSRGAGSGGCNPGADARRCPETSPLSEGPPPPLNPVPVFALNFPHPITFGSL